MAYYQVVQCDRVQKPAIPFAKAANGEHLPSPLNIFSFFIPIPCLGPRPIPREICPLSVSASADYRSLLAPLTCKGWTRILWMGVMVWSTPTRHDMEGERHPLPVAPVAYPSGMRQIQGWLPRSGLLG